MIRGAAFAAVAAVTVSVGLLAASCSAPPGVLGSTGIEKTYGSDAAGRLTLRVSSGSIRAADDLVLEVEARASKGWTATLPEIPDPLGRFTVLDRGPENRRLAPDGALTMSRTYQLQPFLPGAYSIPSLTVTFESGDGKLYSVESEEVPIQVASVLPPQIGEQDIEGMTGPHAMPSRMPLWLGLGAAAFG